MGQERYISEDKFDEIFEKKNLTKIFITKNLR